MWAVGNTERSLKPHPLIRSMAPTSAPTMRCTMGACQKYRPCRFHVSELPLPCSAHREAIPKMGHPSESPGESRHSRARSCSMELKRLTTFQYDPGEVNQGASKLANSYRSPEVLGPGFSSSTKPRPWKTWVSLRPKPGCWLGHVHEHGLWMEVRAVPVSAWCWPRACRPKPCG